MENLPQERISIAAIAVAASELVLELCLDYAKTREAFGKPIGSFQHNRFLLAEMATEVHIARVFLNDCVTRLNAGEVDTSLASMAKWWTTELQTKIVDRGVQLFGGYGYMTEYPIAKAFVDSRIQTIYGGTTEIQKEIIGRMLGPLSLARCPPSGRVRRRSDAGEAESAEKSAKHSTSSRNLTLPSSRPVVHLSHTGFRRCR